MFDTLDIFVDMCYLHVAEVTNCEQADMDFRGHGLFAEPGGVMDYDEDRRSKR